MLIWGTPEPEDLKGQEEGFLRILRRFDGPGRGGFSVVVQGDFASGGMLAMWLCTCSAVKGGWFDLVGPATAFLPAFMSP